MLLALDTATRMISIALATQTEIHAEATWHTLNHHTVELSPAVHSLMSRVNVHASDLTALAVTRGPGSYTGLRIGMSLAKGIAFAAEPALPIVGVPTLDVVAAAQRRRTARLCAVAQAGRGRINAGYYAWQESRWQPAGDPTIMTWDDLLDDLDAPLQIAGEIAPDALHRIREHPYAIASGLAAGVRRAGFLAQIAWKRLQAGDESDPAVLAPVYLS